MFDFIYYNLMNRFYFYSCRRRALSILHEINAKYEMHSKIWVTAVVLASVGLKINDQNVNNIPWYIYLSDAQKEFIKSANEYGYFVCLK